MYRFTWAVILSPSSAKTLQNILRIPSPELGLLCRIVASPLSQTSVPSGSQTSVPSKLPIDRSNKLGLSSWSKAQFCKTTMNF